jgi:hypothetical protein
MRTLPHSLGREFQALSRFLDREESRRYSGGSSKLVVLPEIPFFMAHHQSRVVSSFFMKQEGRWPSLTTVKAHWKAFST